MLPDDNEEEQDVELSASGPESFSGREDLQEGISQGNEQVIDDVASSEASGVNPSAARNQHAGLHVHWAKSEEGEEEETFV